MSQYIITYFNVTCPSEQHFTDNGSVTVNSPLTSTLIPLQSGQLYNISVRASNAVGVSPAVSGAFWTPASEGIHPTWLYSCMYSIVMYSFITVPSASPEMVNASLLHFSSIDVRWGEVPCIYRNGEITGYVVMYNKISLQRSSRQIQKQMVVMDGHAVTINNLTPLTEYSVMVAGVNSAGTGQFSKPVTVVTEGISETRQLQFSEEATVITRTSKISGEVNFSETVTVVTQGICNIYK